MRIQIDYYDRWVLINLALFIGTFMVLYTGPDGFGDAIRDRDFYKAAIPSCLAAYIVLALVSRSFKKLDASHPWYANWSRRAALQLYYGVVIPSLVLMGFFAIYFIERGHPDIIPHYYGIDYPFAVAMVVAINIIYLSYFLQKTRDARRAMRIWLAAQFTQAAQDGVSRLPIGPSPKGLMPGSTAFLLPKKAMGKPTRKQGRAVRGILEHIDREKFQRETNHEIACYDNRGLKESVWEYRMDGTREFNMKLTVMDLYELLDGQQFFEYDKFSLVNRDAIAEPYRKGVYWFLPLKVKFIIDGAEQVIVLKVTKRRRNAFEAWWFGEPTESD